MLLILQTRFNAVFETENFHHNTLSYSVTEAIFRETLNYMREKNFSSLNKCFHAYVYIYK